MSAADFPWLAGHRVDTAVLPAAGYVEMILQALGGPPAHFEVLEFGPPCLLSGEPVRLRTELEPAPGPGETFRFRIWSLPRPGAAENGPHCTGQVTKMPNGASESALPPLDRSRFAAAGPGRRQDPRTGELLLELELDDARWRDGQRAGYLLPPPLLDGALQAFLPDLGPDQDVGAQPRRMAGLTVGRRPSSARLVGHVVPPAGDGPQDRGSSRCRLASATAAA